MSEENELEIYRCIRFDFGLRLGSVLDMISFMTGKDSSFASKKFKTLQRNYPQLNDFIVRIQVNGQGTPTPMASVETLLVLASLLSPKDFNAYDQEYRQLRWLSIRWAFDRSVSLEDLFPNQLTPEAVYLEQIRVDHFIRGAAAI